MNKPQTTMTNPTFNKLLVANRGEIAVRILRAARELGIQTVAVYSDADATSLATQIADESINIGPAPAAQSYLNQEAILNAAITTGAGAIHPGYGFLAENAEFAEAVTAAGIIFVGPSGQAIRTMGDKSAARAAARRAGVPIVPGSDVIHDVDEAIATAAHIGYPVMIKASAGGGGRGIRIAVDEASLRRECATAQAEAQAAFGNSAIYLERYIAQARHIEVQILGDGRDVVHCFERECSLQRRRQKIWEEAPSATIEPAVREALCESAVRLARAVQYSGAGTLEYLYDDATREFFFIEMNTRIQVEHPVTEMVTGVDLVREMLRIARGEPLRLRQQDISLRGTAIEVRINAENPAKNFLPCPGTVTALTIPGGPGVRFDSMLFSGYRIPPFYDSLLGKLIVHDEDRPAAIARLMRALDELRIEGVTTTRDLHRLLAAAPQVQNADFHTGFIESWLPNQSLE